ncbi:unnamed protein product [Ceratitis capitata]|uniref:(Mediterranean fruit fly) hypothetical protein n=1 Tax=Ceratitis capitata TaxID=7213 RepID=A0A811UP34_CERCA|nr:unnamed protein product [Ceratitis capitata]
MTTTRNDKKSQSENDELNSSVGRERSDCFDTHTIEAETELLDEEAHNVQNDHIRLESIKRQILTKLGLKHKPMYRKRYQGNLYGTLFIGQMVSRVLPVILILMKMDRINGK